MSAVHRLRGGGESVQDSSLILVGVTVDSVSSVVERELDLGRPVKSPLIVEDMDSDFTEAVFWLCCARIESITSMSPVGSTELLV